MRNVLVCGNYGATNLGDEAILDGVINLIRAADPSAKITALSANPEETASLHKVNAAPFLPCGIRSFFKSIFGGDISKTLSAIANCDHVILGGGGLFTDEKMMAIVIWSIHNAFFHIYKKPVFCLGQSVGPLRTFFGRRMTKHVYERAALATVRDESSQKLLHALGIPETEALSDPAFSLHLDASNQEHREKYVVLSMRPWINGDRESIHNTCAAVIGWMYEQYGLKTVLVPFQIHQDNDETVLNNILSKLKIKDSAQLFEYTTDYKKVIQLISRSSGVIGMRLHSLIFSALTGTPFIALSYSSKVTSFAGEMESQDYCIDYENLKQYQLKERINLLMEKHEIISNKLHEKALEMRVKSHGYEKYLRTFFGLD